jgi:small GTP-binding protein
LVVLFKCVLIGDGAVGKTALREQVDETSVKYQIWDLAGQTRFGDIRPIYYKRALGGLVVFDCTRPGSFKNLNNWIEECWAHNGRGEIPLVILGNKADLKAKEANHITNEQGEQYAAELSQRTEPLGFTIPYLETSAKTALNVDQAFESLGRMVLKFVEERQVEGN